MYLRKIYAKPLLILTTQNLMIMRQIKTTLIIIFFIFTYSEAESQFQKYSISVKNNGYKGWLAISGRTNFFFLHDETSLILHADSEGSYYLNTGATIGDCHDNQTSYIYIFFNKLGLIDSICPSESASITADKKGISLNTAPVNIDPGKFDRAWYPSFGVDINIKQGFYYGKQTLQLIKGQTYAIDDSHSALIGNDQDYASYFYFTVNKSGKIILYDKASVSAAAVGNTLKFKTVNVVIDPNEISNGRTLYIRKPSSQTIPILKKTCVPFIRGVVNNVFWKDDKGQEVNFQFLPM